MRPTIFWRAKQHAVMCATNMCKLDHILQIFLYHDALSVTHITPSLRTDLFKQLSVINLHHSIQIIYQSSFLVNSYAQFHFITNTSSNHFRKNLTRIRRVISNFFGQQQQYHFPCSLTQFKNLNPLILKPKEEAS